MTAPEQQAAPGPCPIDGCGWDAEGTLDEHLYEHDYNELRPTVVRLALENDQLRVAEVAAPVQPPADLHEPPTNLHARIYRAVYLSPAGAAAEAVLAELEPELAALREQLVAAQAEIARLRADLAAVDALHHPVQHAGLTICDACSPRRRDGPDRYVLMPHPCPTADALNAATAPTT